jgi:phosphoribosylanthranilate isomerase
MSSIVVKICGITNLEDAQAAAQAGANALGFIFYDRSKRGVTPEQATAIIRAAPASIVKVGVFVDAAEEFVQHTLRECGLDLLQFHGNETPEYCAQFGVMTMKAFRVKGPECIVRCAEYATDAFLLDTYSDHQLGGTGECFNWDLVEDAKKLGRPVFLAGGLTPENVGEAIRQARPYGVDVASGVEISPGRKDHAKVRSFIENAKKALVPA